MHRKLLEVLIDPATGEPLDLANAEQDKDGSIIRGALVSPSGSSYPIVHGVPRFVSKDDYSGSFGLQWNRFATVQLDSTTGAAYSRCRFESEVPWHSGISGEWVVDAGCGSGRFSEIAADYGAEVIGVDLSSAVDAANANLGHRPNVHIIQADLRNLPLRKEAIGFLFSLGVLQHTPDPIQSASQLVRRLPSDGRFAFTIYGRKPWTKLHSKYLLRPFTTRLAPPTLLRAIEFSMPILFPATSFLFRLPHLGRICQVLVPVANYVERTDISRNIRYAETILDTFDMLAPMYDRPVTTAEIEWELTPLVRNLTFTSTIPVVVDGVRR